MPKEKEHNQFFMHVYRTMWDYHYPDGTVREGYWQAPVWKQLFGDTALSNLPVTTKTIEGSVISADGDTIIYLTLRPSGPKGCRKHRVFTKCFHCGKQVQAGRIAQHRC